MADLSKLSNEELLKLRDSYQKPQPTQDLSKLSNEELLAMRDSYKQDQVPSGERKFNASVEGFGQGALMGYLPQVQALAAPSINRAMDLATGNNVVENESKLEKVAKLLSLATPAGLINEGINAFRSPDYIKERDDNIARQKGYEQDVGGYYTGGQVVGALAGSVLPARALGALGKGAQVASKGGLLARLGKASAAGAATAAIQNPGDVEGQFSGLQLEERKDNAKTGAILGGLIQGGGEVVKKLGSVLKGTKKQAEALAVKAAGANKRVLNELIGKDRVEEVGRELLDSGLVKAGDTVDDIFLKSSQLKQKVGQEIGDIYQTVNRQGGFKSDPNKLATDIIDAVADSRPTIGAKSYDNKMADVIEELISEPEKLNDVRHINDIIGELDKRIKYSRMDTQFPEAEQGYHAIRTYLRKSLNNLVDTIGQRLGDPEMANRLKNANRSYGNLSTISAMSRDRVSADLANRMFSLTDNIAGAASGVGAMATGVDPAIAVGTGLLGAGVNRVGRRYGLPILSTTLDKVGSASNSLTNLLPANQSLSPGLLGQFGGRLGSDTKYIPRGLLTEKESNRRVAKEK